MSLQNNCRQLTTIWIVLVTISCLKVTGQDSTFVPTRLKSEFISNPNKATMLAVAFPGLGQIYNRSYWKVPFVYGGFVGIFYSITYNSSKHDQYLIAYQDFIDSDPHTVSYQNLEALKNIDPNLYDPVLNPSYAAYIKDRLIRGVDYYKRYRDLSYIGLGGWFLITILDANVDASLSSYDISDNLKLTFNPIINNQLIGNNKVGILFNLQCSF